MIIVSDTSPIVALLKADCLWVLEKMFSRVIIPKGVYDELGSNDNFIEEQKEKRRSGVHTRGFRFFFILNTT